MCVISVQICYLKSWTPVTFYMTIFCLVFVMLSCASVYRCIVVPCSERADLLALVFDV